jgi:cell division protein FtsQ
MKTKAEKKRSGKISSGSSVAASKRSRVAKARRKKPTALRRKSPQIFLPQEEAVNQTHKGKRWRRDFPEKNAKAVVPRDEKRKHKTSRASTDKLDPSKLAEGKPTRYDSGEETKNIKAGHRKSIGRRAKQTTVHKLEPSPLTEGKPEHMTSKVSIDKAAVPHKVSGKTKPLRMAALIATLLISLAVLLWVYTGTGVLNIKKIEVRGNHVLDSAYLRSLSGITADTHLLKMNVKAVEEALSSEPYVASVSVSRRFPNTVVLDIKEREPQSIIYQNGKFHLVDHWGVVLASSEERPQGLVEIKGVDVPLLYPGQQISGDNFTTVADLISDMPSSLREITKTIGYRNDNKIYLESKGTTVIYGENSDLSRKNNIALLALTGLVSHYKGVEYIDVSFPDHPVIKPL